MKYFKVFFAIISLLALTSCTESNSKFVTVENSRFMLEGKPYYYFGTNFWHGAYLGANLVDGDRQRLIRELDQLKEYKITNLRVMASSELSELKRSVKPAFINKPGEYNERLLVGLDFLLAEMAKRDMKAVLVLNNFWQWSGGMAQYTSWNTGDKVIDPDIKGKGKWQAFQHQSANFYTSTGSNTIYKDYIRTLVERINTITNVAYKEDQTIMAWQLANEPRPAPDAKENSANSDAFINWVDETAKFIKSIAPNQLVSTGNEGIQGCRSSKDIYINSHNTKHIDYLTFHIWPKNWKWFDAKNPELTFDNALLNTQEYFSEHIAIARQLNKPTVLEEFGMERDGGYFHPDSTTNYRDMYLTHLFSSVVDSAKAGSPMAGLNFWAWGGEAKATHDDYIWRSGDSFMGDPPQEPQGLNSVFSSDTTTLNVFKKYNSELSKLVHKN